MDSDNNLLGKGLLEARKHSENPILRNIQGGIYKAITLGGEDAPPDPAIIPILDKFISLKFIDAFVIAS